MFVDGRPRYWIDWYDRWHLLLPVLLVALLAYRWWFNGPQTPALTHSGFTPNQQTSRPRTPSVEPTSPTPTQNSTTTSTVPMRSTILESPQNGKGFAQNRIADAEGFAQVGATIYLEYTDASGVWTTLNWMSAESDGRFRFQLKNFPPGSYKLRARAAMPDGQKSISNEAMIVVTADPARLPRRSRPR